MFWERIVIAFFVTIIGYTLTSFFHGQVHSILIAILMLIVISIIGTAALALMFNIDSWICNGLPLGLPLGIAGFLLAAVMFREWMFPFWTGYWWAVLWRIILAAAGSFVVLIVLYLLYSLVKLLSAPEGKSK